MDIPVKAFGRDDMDNNELLKKILASLTRFFGSLEFPNYSKIQEAYEKHPHVKLVTELERHYAVKDVTDLNDDVAVILALNLSSRQFRLELSLIDKFAVLFLIRDGNSIVISDQNSDSELSLILNLLIHEGFTILPKEILKMKIPLRRVDSESSSIYNALFTDVDVTYI